MPCDLTTVVSKLFTICYFPQLLDCDISTAMLRTLTPLLSPTAPFSRSGPLSLVFPAGQRVCRLPTHLEGCTHALMWPWEPDTEPARASKGIASDGCVTLVEASFLLYALNELLTRTAVMLQPLTCIHGDGGGSSGAGGGGGGEDVGLLVVDIPLPLEQRGGREVCLVTGEWELGADS